MERLCPDDVRDAPLGLHAEYAEVRPALWALLEMAVAKSTWPIYLHGQAGRGKTCAMAVLYRRWLRGAPLWLRLSGFMGIIAECRRAGQITLPGTSQQVGESHMWRTRVEQPGLLCVDDVGIREPTSAQFEMMYELVDRRGNKPVIYTSNLSPAELQQVYDGRISSRMLSGIDIELSGHDRRLAAAQSVKV